MVFWLWVIIGILLILLSILLIKIYLLKKAAMEIGEAFADRLITDTNTLIDISTGDRHMQKLANTINIQLRKLRTQSLRFRQGDQELKDAVTNISHDLRTPLTAIMGYLDLLEQEETSEAALRYTEIIRNRTEILNQLTEELFQYSVIIAADNSLSKENVVINEVLEESIASFYTAFTERGITPRIQLPGQKVERLLNRSDLARVFSNLLNNAVKYSDGDLKIVLTENGQITFTNKASDLSGIQVGKLFDRFYTVETARKSTGLGLAIAKTLVEQMDGKISASYENNRLCICMEFPG